MTYVRLPTNKVKDAAEKAGKSFDPAKHGLEGWHAEAKRRWFENLAEACRAQMLTHDAPSTIAVEPDDFSWIRRDYDFGGRTDAAKQSGLDKPFDLDKEEHGTVANNSFTDVKIKALELIVHHLLEELSVSNVAGGLNLANEVKRKSIASGHSLGAGLPDGLAAH